MKKSFKEMRFAEAHQEVSADFKVSASGRKVPVQRKAVKDIDDVEMTDKEVKEGAVPAHMQGKQKPYVSSDGKGNFEVLGNKGQTKATFSRKEHGKDAQEKARAHLKSKYDEYMKEDTELDEAANKSDIPAYLRKKTGDKLTTQDLEKERTQNRSHPETIKKINGTSVKEDLDEATQVHRVSLTLTDPNHSMTTMRKQKMEKRVKVHARDQQHAVDSAIMHFKKQGYKVHDHNYIGLHKESVEQIEEAADKEEGRLVQLARLGLVDKASVSKLRTAVEQLKSDKPLSVAQRSLLLNVFQDLLSLVTGDDQIFNRVKLDVQKESTEQIEEGEGAWKVETPWRKAEPKEVKDKSGAVHTDVSRVRHLARLALLKQQKKSK